ncbi:unnamed protein product, partial [Cyprideis torosa]
MGQVSWRELKDDRPSAFRRFRPGTVL